MRALVVEDNVAQLNGLAEIIEESFPDIECLKAACYDDALLWQIRTASSFFCWIYSLAPTRIRTE